jgi:hypothetical protein
MKTKLYEKFRDENNILTLNLLSLKTQTKGLISTKLFK